MLYRQNFYLLFKRQALKNPNKVALVIENEEYTYDELLKKTELFAEKLKTLSGRKRKHIATFLENSLEMVVFLLATSKLGLTLVPLPPDFPQEFAEDILKTCDVEAAITQTEREFKGIETIKVKDFLELPINVIEWNVESNLDLPFIITTTSGSTGKPKPIVLTQRIKLKRALKGAKEVFNLSEEDTYIVSTPLYHSLAQRFTLLPLITGATVVVMKKFSIQRWFQLVEKYKVTFAVLVSSQLENIVSYLWESKKSYKLESLKKLVSSSAPLLEKTRKRALELSKTFGWEVYETYGTSEIGFASILNMTKETPKWNSVGKPLPYVDVKILSQNSFFNSL
jgi:acyl-CoA synthetase (AMP-forming)/AMP-acid ligase II